NERPFDDPSTIVLAYGHSPSHISDPQADGEIQVAVGSGDGSGAYSFSTFMAVPDHTPDFGEALVNFPQLARINDMPAMIYNQTPNGGWQRDCYYTFASNVEGSAGWGSGVALPQLNGINNGANRTLFDIGGHAAFATNYNHVNSTFELVYLVSDAIGPALGSLTEVVLPDTAGGAIHKAFSMSSGEPAILSSWWGWGARYQESSSTLGEQPSDWGFPRGRMTGSYSDYPYGPVGIELGDGSVCIAYVDNPNGPNVWYSLYFKLGDL
ncbi:MAG: hypothetical protein M3R04_00995, partial [bacterium]|nr:hypothetical protein [bacterium]